MRQKNKLMAAMIATVVIITSIFEGNANAQVFTTVAGTGTAGYTGDGGSALSANLQGCSGVSVDRNGNIYISDNVNNVIRKVSKSGIITTVAGNGVGGLYLNNPKGTICDTSNNLYIADYGNNQVKILKANGIGSVFAGNGNSGYKVGGGTAGIATTMPMNGPTSLAIDAIGNVYISDANNYVIRIVTKTATPNGPSAGWINTCVGGGFNTGTGSGILALQASLTPPQGIIMINGTLFIAEPSRHMIRKVKFTYNANLGMVPGDINTVTSFLSTYYPTEIAINKRNIYISSQNVSKVLLDSLTSNDTCISKKIIDGSSVNMYPRGIATDTANNLYISDFYNNVIRKVDYSSIILPVEFSNLQINKISQQQALLKWDILKELNDANFIVEKSTDGRVFKNIGLLKSSDGINGKYEFNDYSTFNSTNYYRIKCEYKDGSYSFSNVVSISFNSNISEFTISPNPATDIVKIIGKNITSVSLSDIAGKNIITKKFTDATNPEINISYLKAGIYTAVITTTDKKVQIIKFIKND